MNTKMTEQQKLVLKLAYCAGIGLVGKQRILLVAEQLATTDFRVDELIQIAGLTKTKEVFRQSWQRLNDDYLQTLLVNQHYVTIFDSQYPAYLKQLAFPPQVLFYEGHLALLAHPKLLGFVGAREATNYAQKVVQKLIPPLVDQNIVIVSGLARGVDQWSHRQTIAAGGQTIGVVACGLDNCYPRESFPVFSEMKQHHLVLSEYPYQTPPKKHHFPMRNRIIAGLSDGVCVIEAKERSGALITAQLAMEIGRDVFAVPGDILSGQSEGCHQLIQDGAICTTTLKNILNEVAFHRLVETC